jgi:hypothetical protein
MRRRRSKNNHDEPSSLGILLGKIAKLFFALCLLAAAVEALSGLAMDRIRGGRSAAIAPLTDAQIAALYDTDRPLAYREVLAENAALDEAVYEPLVEYRLPARSGKHFTIAPEGYRGNGDPQDLRAPGAKVFVFGGSTAFGTGVSGNETIAAHLQAVLRDAGKGVQVFNFGVPSWFSTQERIALERLLTAGIKPDVAVFVDGLSDFQSCQVPDRSAWSERLDKATRVAARLPFTAEIAARSDAVALVRWLMGEAPAEAPDRGVACSSDAEVDQVIHRLDTNRRMIAATAQSLGFKAVFVQQPVPTFHYDNTRRPVPVRTDMLSHHMNSAKGYPRMMEMRAGGRLLDENVLWLAEAEPSDGNAYVDTVHYSPRFNRLLAEIVGRHILDGALLP